MARRGELIVMAPVGFRKSEDQRFEKDPDRRVQEAIRLVFDQFERIGSVRQTLLWFHEHGLQLPATTSARGDPLEAPGLRHRSIRYSRTRSTVAPTRTARPSMARTTWAARHAGATEASRASGGWR